jgi:hypothetical protein
LAGSEGEPELNSKTAGLPQFRKIQAPEQPIFPIGYGSNVPSLPLEHRISGFRINNKKVEGLLRNAESSLAFNDCFFY